MKSGEKIHQTELNQWASLIRDQQSSGLNVKDWCLQNDISYHAYYYWKHLLKESFTDSNLADIVPVSIPAAIHDHVSVADNSQPPKLSHILCDSRESRDL